MPAVHLVNGMWVSGGFSDALGLRPAAGHLIAAAETDGNEPAQCANILSRIAIDINGPRLILVRTDEGRARTPIGAVSDHVAVADPANDPWVCVVTHLESDCAARAAIMKNERVPAGNPERNWQLE
jgi:hypothetical protein